MSALINRSFPLIFMSIAEQAGRGPATGCSDCEEFGGTGIWRVTLRALNMKASTAV